MADYKKIVDIVIETETDYIATIWTGPNYYIDTFSKEDIKAHIEYTKACGVTISVKESIATTSVGDMQFMCKNDEFCEELLQDWIAQLSRNGEGSTVP